MEKPVKVNLEEFCPTTRAYHINKARNEAIAEYEAYLEYAGVVLPEVVEENVEEADIVYPELKGLVADGGVIIEDDVPLEDI